MLLPTITFAAALSVLAQLFRGWGGIGAGVTPALLLAIAVGIGIRCVPRGARARVEAGFSVPNPFLQGGSPSASCCSTSSAQPPPHPSSTSASDERPRPGHASLRPPRTAASALIAFPVTVVLGVLFNAPAMKKTAMELPFRGRRSFSLALVNPAAAAALGKPDPGATPVAVVVVTPLPTAQPTQASGERRPRPANNPLRSRTPVTRSTAPSPAIRWPGFPAWHWWTFPATRISSGSCSTTASPPRW